MKTLTDKFNKLQSLGFQTPKFSIVPKDQIQAYFEATKVDRENGKLSYDIDGLVISVDDIETMEGFGYSEDRLKPKGQIALKFPAEGAVVQIKNITWSSEGGSFITPVAEFEPVIISGAEIRRASLKSFEWCIENKVGVGSTVEISRRGDVIPCIEKIISNLAALPLEIPTICSHCGSKIEPRNAYLACINDSCFAKEANRINYFLSTLKIKGLAWASLLEYTKSGVTLLDILEVGDFSQISNKIKDNKSISLKVWEKVRQQLLK